MRTGSPANACLRQKSVSEPKPAHAAIAIPSGAQRSAPRVGLGRWLRNRSPTFSSRVRSSGITSVANWSRNRSSSPGRVNHQLVEAQLRAACDSLLYFARVVRNDEALMRGSRRPAALSERILDSLLLLRRERQRGPPMAGTPSHARARGRTKPSPRSCVGSPRGRDRPARLPPRPPPAAGCRAPGP
jgi:hypothetical protein